MPVFQDQNRNIQCDMYDLNLHVMKQHHCNVIFYSLFSNIIPSVFLKKQMTFTIKHVASIKSCRGHNQANRRHGQTQREPDAAAAAALISKS